MDFNRFPNCKILEILYFSKLKNFKKFDSFQSFKVLEIFGIFKIKFFLNFRN